MKNINKSLFSKLKNSHSFNMSFIYLDNFNNQPLDVLENILNELRIIIQEMIETNTKSTCIVTPPSPQSVYITNCNTIENFNYIY